MNFTLDLNSSYTSIEKLEEWCYNQHYNLQVDHFNTNLYILFVIMVLHLGLIVLQVKGSDLFENTESLKSWIFFISVFEYVFIIGYILFVLGVVK